MFNPLGFISKFIKSGNQKELDRISKIVKDINKIFVLMFKLFEAKILGIIKNIENGLIVPPAPPVAKTSSLSSELSDGP